MIRIVWKVIFVKVLLAGYFGVESFGDDLILKAAVEDYRGYLRDYLTDFDVKEPEFIVLSRKKVLILGE